MQSIFLATVIVAFLSIGKPIEANKNPEDWENAESIYDFSARVLNSEQVESLEKYRGHVCIIVNVASYCGYTENHYKEMVELYEKYSESKGLRILAFPSDQFLQEPGSETDIQKFIEDKHVKFDVYEKIDVNGADTHPLWKYLKQKQGGILGDFIKWNFTKFIIDKNGQPVERFGPTTSPNELVPTLEKYW